MFQASLAKALLNSLFKGASHTFSTVFQHEVDILTFFYNATARFVPKALQARGSMLRITRRVVSNLGLQGGLTRIDDPLGLFDNI